MVERLNGIQEARSSTLLSSTILEGKLQKEVCELSPPGNLYGVVSVSVGKEYQHSHQQSAQAVEPKYQALHNLHLGEVLDIDAAEERTSFINNRQVVNFALLEDPQDIDGKIVGPHVYWFTNHNC